MPWISFGVFIFGLFWGSFLNVVIARFENPKTILKGRSKCDFCEHTLGFWDLLPVVSFFLLRGKCRYCGKPISYQNPLVELITGLLFVAIVWKFHLGLPAPRSFSEAGSALSFILLFSFLIPLFFIDLKKMLVPDWLAIPALFLSFIIALFTTRGLSEGWLPLSSLIHPFLGLLIGAGPLALLVLFSRGRWLGSGDIYFGAILGLLSSFPLILLSLPLAFFLGGIVASILLLTHLRTLKDPIPFAPFLIISIFVVLFLREGLEAILRFYLPF